MKARNILAFALSFVLAAAVLAQGSGEAKAKSAPKAKAGAPVVMPAGDLKWTDLDPTGAPGVKIADLWGDHTKGAFGAFTKFPAGFAAPLHTHTNACKIVVVSGTFVYRKHRKVRPLACGGREGAREEVVTAREVGRRLCTCAPWAAKREVDRVIEVLAPDPLHRIRG